MKISKIWLIGMALIVSLPVTAEIRTIAEAYEVTLSDLQPPTSEHGVVSFKQCSTCKLQVIKVTEHTQYVFNQENLKLSDFRKSISKVRDRSSVSVTVKHHLETDTVVWISVTL